MWRSVFLLAFAILCTVSAECPSAVSAALTPVWYNAIQSVYFTNYNQIVNGPEPVLLRYDFNQDKIYCALVPGMSAAFVHPLGQNLFVIGSSLNTVLVKWDGISKNATVVNTIFSVPKSSPTNHIGMSVATPLRQLIGGGFPNDFCESKSKLF